MWKVKQFLQAGCGCSKDIKGGQCSQQFLEVAVIANLNNGIELSHGELDLVILANIQASTFIEISGEKRKRSPTCSFTFQARANMQGISQTSVESFVLFHGGKQDWNSPVKASCAEGYRVEGRHES